MGNSKAIRIFLLAACCWFGSGTGAQTVSLLPLPQELSWKKGTVTLNRFKRIVINDTSLGAEARQLQQHIRQLGQELSLGTVKEPELFSVSLFLGKVSSPLYAEEAYQLEVNPKAIKITANTAHGIFNGIQTLRQLAGNGLSLPAVFIKDWPAFSWRGYMVDVGRNYLSPELLKQQIDIMARYKLNVFHFHATEDIAWRFESKLYPQLNAPENMLRRKGSFYSEAEVKELIAYCRERHIRFVPEIDMPGHSAAFKRAMNTGMQSDSGLYLVKNLLREFCDTYDVEYFHIGGDEVKITNPGFIPAVSELLRQRGKKLIGWQPGGNFTDPTIRQLWMDDKGKITSNRSLQYLDSRHLYLNHMDPLESVVTLFNRQIGNRDHGDSNALGGIICVWHDRNINSESDVLRMNPVYPGMLAFSERSWRGGGQEGWVANISDGDETAFASFEKRLLQQKQLWFGGLPFPYTASAGTRWYLYGPFDNGGDTSKKFAPEETGFRFLEKTAAARATGSTIVMRHWWAPLIKGAVEHPVENSTWYAYTRIWSGRDTTLGCWIGFYNLSRSPATDPPPLHAWDERGSAVWVNGKTVAPPLWKRGGQKGGAEIPLQDEGYEYRAPALVAFKKGWNDIVVKCPVGSFKARDGQNPVKWMFTFALAPPEAR